jgi:hypothetical protein
MDRSDQLDKEETGTGNRSDPFVWTHYFLPVSPAEAEESRRYAEYLYQSSWVQRRHRLDARRAVRREARALAKLVLGILWEKLLA